MRSSLALLGALAVLAAACAPAATDDPDAPASATADPDTRPEAAPPARPVAPEPAEPVEADPLAVPAAGGPVAPDDPDALAEILRAAHERVRDPERPPEDLAAAGHWQQVVYRKLATSDHLLAPVLDRLPAELHAAVRGNVFAGSRLAAMHAPADDAEPAPPRDLPGWRIVDPPPADLLKSYYEEAQAATGVHWTYLAAVNLVETRMGRIRGDSHAGAQGPMQFMPATWAEWGEGDVHDHRDAIMAAGRYLRWGGMPDDVDGALFRYNRDVRYVDAVRTYAEQMQADPRAYYGYYHWQVYYFTGVENVWLAPGYDGGGA